jgi:hypothetical protein
MKFELFVQNWHFEILPNLKIKIRLNSYQNEKTYSFFLSRSVLRFMVSFGNWLKSNKIPIKNVRYWHVNEYLAALFPHHLGKLSRQKTGARKAVSLTLEKYPPKRSVFQCEADRFRTHLHSNRGLSEKECLRQAKCIEKLLVYAFPKKRIQVHSLKPGSCERLYRKHPLNKVQLRTNSRMWNLKSLFRFLELHDIKIIQLRSFGKYADIHAPGKPFRVKTAIEWASSPQGGKSYHAKRLTALRECP